MHRLWFDTEFLEDGSSVELLSIGVVRDDGATFYAEVAGVDTSRANAFVRQHVLPQLTGPVLTKDVLRAQLLAFAGPTPEWWAWHCAYDWVCLRQLYGPIAARPESWPISPRDLQHWADLVGFDVASVPHDGAAHHALADAQWAHTAWQAIRAHCQASGLPGY